MTRTLRLLASSLLALAAACTATHSRQTVPMPDQTVELSDPQGARVYLVRRDHAIWQRWSLRVYIGSTELASLAPGSYLCWETGPGRILARLVLDRAGWEGGETERLYDVVLEPGNTYWVAVSLDSQSGVPAPERLEPDAGRALVARSEPATPAD